eukprot:gene513-648_t
MTNDITVDEIIEKSEYVQGELESMVDKIKYHMARVQVWKEKNEEKKILPPSLNGLKLKVEMRDLITPVPTAKDIIKSVLNKDAQAGKGNAELREKIKKSFRLNRIRLQEQRDDPMDYEESGAAPPDNEFDETNEDLQFLDDNNLIEENDERLREGPKRDEEGKIIEDPQDEFDSGDAQEDSQKKAEEDFDEDEFDQDLEEEEADENPEDILPNNIDHDLDEIYSENPLGVGYTSKLQQKMSVKKLNPIRKDSYGIQYVTNTRGVNLLYNKSKSRFFYQAGKGSPLYDLNIHQLEEINIYVRNFASKSGEIKINLDKKFKTYLCDGPTTQTTTNKDELLSLFKEMTEMRRIEIVADSLYKKKLIRGFCHLYNGQEAVCTGMERSITKDDHVITAYRDHTFMLARGATPEEVLAELLMKSTGCSKGKGGSMHMFTKNFYGGNGIVGAQTPIGAGIALAQKYNKTGNVCLTYYGDGAANQGQLFEAFNMAALWKLPCIFICENNHYGMGTAEKRAAAGDDFYTRAHFIPGIYVDGMDVFAVKQAGKWAVDWCRAGKGPLVMEMDTYRYVGHSMSDPGTTYRTRDEVNEVRKIRDPIEHIRNLILANKCATEEELVDIEEKVRVRMDEAAEFAINSPFPEPKELFTNVYKEVVPIRAVEFDKSFRP